MCAQIGSGAGSSFPASIDTKQTWVNGANPDPDSASRVDAEALNDLATAIVNVQTVLGASPAGAFATVRARLEALATSISDVTVATNLNFLPAGAGAVPTTIQNKLRQFPTVKDFGAVGNGTTNDHAAFVLADSAGPFLIPPGTYSIGSALALTKPLLFEPGASFTGAGAVTFAAECVQELQPQWFGAVGDGVANDTAAMQRCVNAASGAHVAIDLGGRTYNISTVNLPTLKSLTIRNGHVTVINAGAMGFSKTTTVTPPFTRHSVTFENLHFSRAVTGGACIYINLAWQDHTGGIVVNPNCSFRLTNGAVGIRLGLSFGNVIGGRFEMDESVPGGLSTAILCDETVGGSAVIPSNPFDSVVDHAFFITGIAFDQIHKGLVTHSAFEGFRFGPGCSFYVSEFRAQHYNSLALHGCHMVSCKALFDSGINTTIDGGYWDRNSAAHGPLITVKTTTKDCLGFVVSGGAVLSAQGTAGALIQFTSTGAAPGTQISNVVIGDVLFVGAVNDIGTAIQGIRCSHTNLRNLNVTGGASFLTMYSCLLFDAPVNRSVIRAFDARDITFYAESVAVGYGVGQFNRFDGIWRVIELEMTVPTYVASGVDEAVLTNNLQFESMMRPPGVTVTNIVSTPAGQFTVQVPASYRDGITVRMVKLVAAPGGGRGVVTATLTLDASGYLAPL